jgi:hypothetical protein
MRISGARDALAMPRLSSLELDPAEATFNLKRE